MTSSSQLRGLQRILAREVHVSDLLQHLTDLDSTPWAELIGFVPQSASRERRLAKLGGDKRVKGTLDLLLQADGQEDVAIEVKLGHVFDSDQQERYELSTNGRLLLVGLAGDEPLVRSLEKWDFLRLADVFDAWGSSNSQEATVMARAAGDVIRGWDGSVDDVFTTDSGGKPLDSIEHKFLARVVTRRMADELGERGWLHRTGVSSGSSGTAIVQAFAPIRDDRDRCLIAEVRWLNSLRAGEFRIGVDYDLPESRESRAEVWALAKAMDESIRIDSLREQLAETSPELDRLLVTTGAGRTRVNDEVWMPVVECGFMSPDNPGGVKGDRKSIKPGFSGDRTMRFEAVGRLDFSRANGVDLIDLLDEGLKYLVSRLPEEHP